MTEAPEPKPDPYAVILHPDFWRNQRGPARRSRLVVAGNDEPWRRPGFWQREATKPGS